MSLPFDFKPIPPVSIVPVLGSGLKQTPSSDQPDRFELQGLRAILGIPAMNDPPVTRP